MSDSSTYVMGPLPIEATTILQDFLRNVLANATGDIQRFVPQATELVVGWVANHAGSDDAVARMQWHHIRLGLTNLLLAHRIGIEHETSIFIEKAIETIARFALVLVLTALKK